MCLLRPELNQHRHLVQIQLLSTLLAYTVLVQLHQNYSENYKKLLVCLLFLKNLSIPAFKLLYEIINFSILFMRRGLLADIDGNEHTTKKLIYILGFS